MAARAVVEAALALAVVAYGVVQAGVLGGFLTRQLPSSDTISPVLLVQAIASPHHGTIYLGNHAGYSDLLLSALGLRFPAPMLSPQAVIYAVYLIGALILGWTVRRIAGWRPAIIAALISMLASPLLLFNEASPAGRVTSLTNLAVLGWVLVSLALAPRRSLATTAAASIGAGLMSGVDAISDPLFAAVGLIPFVLTGAALWARRRDRQSAWLAAVVAATTVTAVAGALATRGVAHLLDLHALPSHLQLSSLREMVHNLHLVGAATGATAGQLSASVGSGTMSYVQTGFGVVVAVTVLAALVDAGRTLLGSFGEEPRAEAVATHKVYWALVAGLDLALVLLSNYAIGITTIRYLTPLWLALAALLPLALRQRPVGWVVLTVAVAALAAVDAAAFATLQLPESPSRAPLTVSLESQPITRAYADYWDANIVTWASGGRVAVRQVAPCGGDAAHLCPYDTNAASAWFQPTSGEVAVVVDPRYSLRDPPSPAFGTPERVVRLAGGITVYVYPHDLPLGG